MRDANDRFALSCYDGFFRGVTVPLTLQSKFLLNNGTGIPAMGLGVWQAPAGDVTYHAVREALSFGYRHVDTARIYRNEADVGRAIYDSGLPRSEVFVTTKLWNADHGYDETLRALDASLKRLAMDYVDLYLVHWPVEGARMETWRAMEAALTAGQCRAIGVSNYMLIHLREVLALGKVKPAANQIELHPFNFGYRKPVIDLCAENGITIEAYSPLTRGRRLKDPNLLTVAKKYGKSTAQVLVRWNLQHGFVVLPKSVHAERIRENADVFDFALSAEDMAFLDGLNENLITGWDPTNAP